jgi:hypothetical protein
LKRVQPISIKKSVFDFIYKDDKSDPNYAVTYADPRRPVGG